MTTRLFATGLAGLAALLGACAMPTPTPPPPPPPHGEAAAAFSARQQAAAVEARQEGDLARALALWRTLEPLLPNDADVASAIAELRSEIAREATRAREQGATAYRRGAYREGDSWMRRALALDPEDPRAQEALRQSFTRGAEARQASKIQQETLAGDAEPTADPVAPRETPATPTAPNDADTGDSAAAVQAYLEAAAQARARTDRPLELDQLLAATELGATTTAVRDRIARLRKELGEHWYREGAARFQDDLAGAIEALEKALAYDPDNRAARLKLEQARTLQRNLERIKGGQAKYR